MTLTAIALGIIEITAVVAAVLLATRRRPRSA
jgi:hypothetical protein